MKKINYTLVLLAAVCLLCGGCGEDSDSKINSFNDLNETQKEDKEQLTQSPEMSDTYIEPSDTPVIVSEEPTATPVDDSWKAAYKDYLLNFNIESAEKPMFSFEYIDEDDIPELVIILGYSHVGGRTSIITYYNGAISEAGEIGSYGVYCFEEKHNWVESDGLSKGCYYYNFAKINNGKLETVHNFFDNSESGESSIYYEYDGQAVSKEDYDAKLEEADAGRNIIRREYSDYFEITESNINEQLEKFN